MRLGKLKLPLAIMLAVAALLAINVAPVMAQPVTSPFTGAVTIAGDPALDGSRIAGYVGDETEPRAMGTTSGGIYEMVLVGDSSDIGKPVSFKVKEVGTEEWLDATTDPESPTFAEFGTGELQIVHLSITPPAPTIDFSPGSFSFSATEGGANPASRTLEIWNSGGSILNWTVSDDAPWLSLTPTSDTSTGEHDAVTVSVDISGMSADPYSATITISAPGATNSPQTVPVSLNISAPPAPPPAPVGGTAYPPNKLAILAPWIALGVGVAVLGWLVRKRRRAYR